VALGAHSGAALGDDVLILALDASTDIVTAAVARAEGYAVSKDRGFPGPKIEREILAEISVSSRGASEALLPAVHNALSLSGIDLDQVECILAGVGPGTFTGIRIALATARSLSRATRAVLSKNSTLTALAAPALLDAKEPLVLAVLDAKRRQVFAQHFADEGTHGKILCATPEELSAEDVPLKRDMLIVGDGAVRYRGALSALGRIPPDASLLHRVTAVGHVLSADLTPVSPGEVVPLYVREPDAEVRRDLNPWSKA
jgi:tRNA threonylcarbamoyladenosine biosynthesis protein TsaB